MRFGLGREAYEFIFLSTISLSGSSLNQHDSKVAHLSRHRTDVGQSDNSLAARVLLREYPINYVKPERAAWACSAVTAARARQGVHQIFPIFQETQVKIY